MLQICFWSGGWPEQHFVTALSELAKAGRQAVLMGSPAEAPFVQNLRNQVPGATSATDL
jgi:hypothetical protein